MADDLEHNRSRTFCRVHYPLGMFCAFTEQCLLGFGIICIFRHVIVEDILHD